MRTIEQLARALEAGEETSRSLVEAALERIADPAGEGQRAFVKVYAEEARAAAEAHDRSRAMGRLATPHAGIPISIKDLFDVAGEVTLAGSRAFVDEPPAVTDAPVVARLRAAGLVFVGKTNMTEFAYSGLGINPHHGTPLNPWDRATGRIPGGSTSGGTVSVADGMVPATIGTDTGGSCRIPAALCGIVGFKTTTWRVPRDGAFPLSETMDSVGPLAASVACCAVLDAIMAGEEAGVPDVFPIAGLRLAAPQSYVLDGMDEMVGRAFEAALSRLSGAGARIVEIALDELSELPGINANGGFVGAEAYAWHKPFLDRLGDRYDPWIRDRFEAGRAQSAADYIALGHARRDFIARVARISAPFDALVLPTVPIVAPPLAAMEDKETSMKTNMLLLRNTAVGNFLDRPALTIPCQATGEAPVGLMLMGESGADRRLLAIGLGVEQVLQEPWRKA